jgi:hypothetical protein
MRTSLVPCRAPSSRSRLIHFSRPEGRTAIATRLVFLKRLLLPALAVCLLAPEPASSGDFSLLSLSIRARVSNATTLGAAQPEEADAYDLAVLLALPWLNEIKSGWKIDSRLMASAGLLQSGGDDALTVSLIPGIALRGKGGWLVLDAGAGVALMSRHTLGTQDYGGPFQFALTAGASLPAGKRLSLGYRFMHYSDAGINGDDTTGADLHMVEIGYRF